MKEFLAKVPVELDRGVCDGSHNSLAIVEICRHN